MQDEKNGGSETPAAANTIETGVSTLVVGPEESGKTLEALVRGLLGVAWGRARELVRSGRVEVNGRRIDDSAVRLDEGSTIEVREQGRRIPRLALLREEVAYLDDDVIVVHKAAGALTVPTEEGERDTVVDRVRAYLRSIGKSDDEVGIVHRLDRDTSGLLVFTRTFAAKRMLTEQFNQHTVEREYLAIVHGQAESKTIESMLIRDRGDGLRGSFAKMFPNARGKVADRGTPPPQDAQRALTHVTVVSQLKDVTLVRCRLETGRQHQIRIHMSEDGHALLGETVYIRDHRGKRLAAARLMLHAAILGVDLPSTNDGEPRRLRIMSRPPDDFMGTFARFGGKRKVIEDLLK